MRPGLGSSPKSIIRIPSGSNIYAFGSPSQSKKPLISRINWNVEEGEAWAVVSGTGGGGKSVIFKARSVLKANLDTDLLLGHTRIAPATSETQGLWANAGGLYPFLSTTSVDPYTRVSYVSFRQRRGGEPGAFFDYTARYGAMREEEDKVTLRDTLKESVGHNQTLFETLTEQIGLQSLLDLPMLTLSNGQTRRARVVKAILDQPELLLLDEPLTGLDTASRKALTDTLHHLHHERTPRIIIGLRKGEEIPPWITHILDVEGSNVTSREVFQTGNIITPSTPKVTPKSETQQLESSPTPKSLLVDMKDINVTYGDRKVLRNIDWQIRQGERWHLQGTNGSGKTTLLALLTGDHPQSYTQPHLLLPGVSPTSPGIEPCTPTLRPRRGTPTAHLRQLIGVVSPEMFDAFPRRHPGMSVWEAVTTGFDGGFVPRTREADSETRKKGGVGWVDVADDELGTSPQSEDPAKRLELKETIRKWRIQRCWDVLEALGSSSWSTNPTQQKDGDTIPTSTTSEFASSSFTSLSTGEQRLVLLMRALVGRPPVILLDEVWSGMDDDMIAAARKYLRSKEGISDEQAVVVITHWEDEVPWTGEEVKTLKLEPWNDSKN